MMDVMYNLDEKSVEETIVNNNGVATKGRDAFNELISKLEYFKNKLNFF